MRTQVRARNEDSNESSRRPRARTAMNASGPLMDRRHFLKLAAGAALASSSGFATQVAWATAPAAANYRNLVRADRAQGRQRRTQHGRSVYRPRVLRVAAEDRDRARPGRGALAIASDCILRLRHCCRFGRAATRRRSRASAIPSRIFRISVRSRSGTPRRAATNICRKAGSRAPWRPRRHRPRFAADGVIIGSPDLGPLAGGGTRAIALSNTEQFLRQARLAHAGGPVAQQGAAAHPQGRSRYHAGGVAPVSQSRVHDRISDERLRQRDPDRGAGHREPGRRRGRARHAERLRHAQRPTRHAGAPARRACRTASSRCKGALDELGRWNETLMLTYAEFGRRPKENLSNGTDHGTASAHFVLGGRVAGGLYGEQPSLDALVRRRQSRVRDRFSQRLRDGARALVGRAVGDRAARRHAYAGGSAAASVVGVDRDH